MSELTSTILLVTCVICCAFLTYIGLYDFLKLKLKWLLIFSLGNWLLVGALVTEIFDFASYNISTLMSIGTLPLFALAVIVAAKEDKRSRQIYARLKMLPFWRRFLRKIPRDFFEMPVSYYEEIPSIPFWRLVTTLAILNTGLISVAFAVYIALITYITTNVMGITITAVTGCILISAAALTYKGKSKLGGTLAILFSIIELFTGGFLGGLTALLKAK
ncbi:MAG: hypothetical protein ACPL0C_04615 [Candidatus Bathyarchaeales archaeon]